MSTRDSIISLLAIPLGSQAAAEAKLVEIENLIRRRAAEGVQQELTRQMPTIEAKAQTIVKRVAVPLFIGAASVGGLSLLLGLFARRRT